MKMKFQARIIRNRETDEETLITLEAQVKECKWRIKRAALILTAIRNGTFLGKDTTRNDEVS